MTKDTTGTGPYRAELVDLYWHWETQDIKPIVGYGRFTPESRENRRAGDEVQAYGTANNLRFTLNDMSAEPRRAPIGLISIRIDSELQAGEFSRTRPQRCDHDTCATWLVLDYAFHMSALAIVQLSVWRFPSRCPARVSALALVHYVVTRG